MDKDKLIQRLMSTFLEELEEHVRALNSDLLALEKETDPSQRADRLKKLFRTAHSLKGASRSVNVTLLENACHQLEEFLAGVRSGRASLGEEKFSLLFETADAIEEAGMRLREQQDLTGAPLVSLIPRLQKMACGESEIHSENTEQKGTGVKALSPSENRPDSSTSSFPSRVEHSPQVPPLTTTPASSRVPLVPVDPHPEPATGMSSVRIAAEKLDTLLAQSGELLVARRRVQSRTDELVGLREQASHWKTNWKNVEKSLAKYLDPKPKENGVASGEVLKGLPLRTMQTLAQAGDHFRHMERELERLSVSLAADGRLFNQAAGSLDAEVRRARMLPFAEACQGLDRMVRDLAQAGGKEVELVIDGGDVELDRSVLEGLKDPLRHLVRNAIDHGAETSAERRVAGKAASTRIQVAALLRAGQVEVSVADDGRGLDLDALRRQARQRGLTEPSEERELARLVFLPGFSTARLITDVSGRGVGLDVVKSRVESLRGTVEISYIPGKGTCFTLAVPLTLTTLRALLVQAGDQIYAVPATHVHKLLRITSDEIRWLGGREILTLGACPIPVVSLNQTLGQTAPDWRVSGKIAAVVLSAGNRQVAFVVDELIAEQEILIKNLGARIKRVRHSSAATILPSGRIAFVLNVPHLINTAIHPSAGQTPSTNLSSGAAKSRKRILLAEDSLTTRTLMKTILEAAGFEVAAAVDGAAAWQLLQGKGADLLVSDVDMPRMDGFALTEAVRKSSRYHELPVVLVTARESDQDKARGIEVRADAYLVKSSFDQKNLIETIRQLL